MCGVTSGNVVWSGKRWRNSQEILPKGWRLSHWLLGRWMWVSPLKAGSFQGLSRKCRMCTSKEADPVLRHSHSHWNGAWPNYGLGATWGPWSFWILLIRWTRRNYILYYHSSNCWIFLRFPISQESKVKVVLTVTTSKDAKFVLSIWPIILKESCGQQWYCNSLEVLLNGSNT